MLERDQERRSEEANSLAGVESATTREGTTTSAEDQQQHSACCCWKRRNPFSRVTRTVTLRTCFILSLATAAAVCGVVAFQVTDRLEQDIAVQTYESVAAMALLEATAITHRKQHGAELLSAVLGYAFPDSSQWPLVGLRGYTDIANKVAKLTNSAGHGFMAIVTPEQVPDFEAHAQKLYQDFEYPETAGWSDFGFGIYGRDPNSPWKDGRYHDTTGNTTYGSKNRILAPFLQHNNAFRNPNLLLMNIHQQKFRGLVLDDIIACADAADADPSHNRDESPSCAIVTDFTEIFVLPGPSAVLFQPIFPADDPFTVVGFIGTSIHWEQVLTNVVPDYVDGLDCVISNGAESYTYQIHNGVPKLMGPGDLHDHAFTHHGHSILLTDDIGGAVTSKSYKLTVYPTTLMFDEFHTGIPLYVSLSFVGLIVVVMCIFFVYDHFMKYESHQRKKILQLKRRFVRFISHEIRTPLNVVCMGLELLQSELYDSSSRPSAGNIKSNDNETALNTTREVTCSENPSLLTTTRLTASTSQDCSTTLPLEALVPHWLGLTRDILVNTQTAVSVLNDVLNYDKIESGTFALEVGLVNVWRLAQKTVAEFSTAQQSIELDIVINGWKDEEECPLAAVENLCVVGDSIRLAQVMRNFISNALKFTPDDGKITVTVSFVPDGLPDAVALELAGKSNLPSAELTRSGSVRISVADTGVGLSSEQLGLVFQEGVQFDPSRLQQGGGSGFGLCITKEIVERHGGIIYAESPGPGLGSNFLCEIPLFESVKACDDQQAWPRGSGGGEGAYSNPASSQQSRDHHHILVVDDVALTNKMLVRLLERAGHTCIAAGNGQEAVDAYVANKMSVESATKYDHVLPIDTILMDFEMPILNGPTATKRLREMGCDAYIFGVSGNVLTEDVALFKAHGADHVIPKPVNLAAIDACWASMVPQ